MLAPTHHTRPPEMGNPGQTGPGKYHRTRIVPRIGRPEPMAEAVLQSEKIN